MNNFIQNLPLANLFGVFEHIDKGAQKSQNAAFDAIKSSPNQEHAETVKEMNRENNMYRIAVVAIVAITIILTSRNIGIISRSTTES
jgi:hypothetical protein